MRNVNQNGDSMTIWIDRTAMLFRRVVIIPRPATQDGPLHQMETTAFDDLLIRKAREYGV
jgi:hypothetical protein